MYEKNSAAPAVDISISTSDETAVQEDEDFDESISAISTSPNSFGGISSSLDPDFQLRDFELAYAEMSSSEVAADQPPGNKKCFWCFTLFLQ